MKRKLFIILLSIVSAVCLAFAFTACNLYSGNNNPTEGLEFTLNDDGASYSVTGIGTATDTDIVIPSTYNNFPVTAIGKDAFSSCFFLESVKIPNSVTSIGSYAFDACLALTRVTIGNGVTSIGKGAFNLCSLTSLTIPDSVTEIGDGAFVCATLKSIKVASGNSVYHSAGNCLIETATNTLILGCQRSRIPDDGSVTTIGNESFFACHGLTSIKIPDSVTEIGDGAFLGCWGLTSVTIGNGVTKIGSDAFNMCLVLTSVKIGSGVTEIGSGAFENCSSLASVTFANPDGWWWSNDSTAASGTSFLSSDLTDSATAAKYLSETYCIYYWKCG